ncbi:hypothetical protein IFR05_001680 [Cadophora sp. M221]|nr:hypothetical protein IFR05_001680 [Cadophora sp. M221]
MNSANVPLTNAGGGAAPPRPVRPERRAVRTPTIGALRLARLRARRAQRELKLAERASKKDVAAAPVVPEPEKKIRIYTLEDCTDRASVEAALAEHLARAQGEFSSRLNYVGFVGINGSIFIGFNGIESRVLSHEELVDFVLADKFIAAQFCAAIALSPIPRSFAINLDSNSAYSTPNKLPAPTTAECQAATLQELNQIVPFEFKKLPAEVRKMIYLSSNVFALRHDKQIPAFYQVALCDNFLKEEAKEAYEKINYLLTLANEDTFNTYTMYDIKALNHLYFQWCDLNVPAHRSRYLQLRANRCQIVNNLRSLTMDFSTASEPCNFALMQNISRASSGVHRLTVRLPPMAKLEAKHYRSSVDIENLHWNRHRLINHTNMWIRTTGRLVTVNTADVEEEWFWERDGTQFLDLGPVGKARRKEAPVLGNVTLEDRIEGRSILVR